jgi:hypothetical protein
LGKFLKCISAKQMGRPTQAGSPVAEAVKPDPFGPGLAG